MKCTAPPKGLTCTHAPPMKVAEAPALMDAHGRVPGEQRKRDVWWWSSST